MPRAACKYPCSQASIPVSIMKREARLGLARPGNIANIDTVTFTHKRMQMYYACNSTVRSGLSKLHSYLNVRSLQNNDIHSSLSIK